MLSPHEHPLQSPLGVTARQYAHLTSHLPLPRGHRGGIEGAIERYRRFFREGDADQPHISDSAAPISRVHTSESAEGLVRKFCQALPPISHKAGGDDSQHETESVLIPMIGKKRIRTHTLCLSSQIGCAMGCVFCQTAQMGKLRDLTAAEIVGQWFAARHLINLADGTGTGGCDTIRNIVFMGMGEPMDNLPNVIQAIAVLTDSSGPALPMCKITVSTVGRVDGIAHLAKQVNQHGWHRLGLAVSLNAPNDDIRSQIMPVNRKWGMSQLRSAILDWPIYSATKICFEYVLIPGVNDQRDHARELADFMLGRGEHAAIGAPSATQLTAPLKGLQPGHLPGLVNLIPYNPRDNSPWPAPTEPQADEFLGWLIEEGVFAKRRRTKGRDTMAACGQLGNPALRKRAPATGAALTVRGTVPAESL